MYVLVPTKVSAIELMSSPDTPKSQILILPSALINMLLGLTSAGRAQKGYRVRRHLSLPHAMKFGARSLTSVDDAMNIIQIRQTMDDNNDDLSADIWPNRAVSLVHRIQRAVHWTKERVRARAKA